MKQNIKNTLYRFVTMRAPELIGDEEKELGFVKFPEGKTSAFYNTSISLSSKSDLKSALYVPTYLSSKDLKEAGPIYYNFAKWVTANRTTMTFAEGNNKMQEFYAVRTIVPDMVKIWEDLHHNILNGGDSYLRDLLLSFIVADFFRGNYTKVAQTDEAYRKLAQARVIIDKRLFSSTRSSTSLREPLPLSEKHFKKELNAIVAKQNCEELEQITKEIQQAKKQFDKENQQAKDTYQETYDGLVRTAYEAATIVERVVTDDETGETKVIEEYQNLVIPDYDFQEVKELDEALLIKKLSTEALAYVTDLQVNNPVATFDEITEVISTEIQDNTSTVFDNIDFGVPEVIVPGGGTIPVGNAPSTTPFSFTCCNRVKIGSTLNNVVMILNMPNASYDVIDMLYTVDYADGTSNTNGVFNETKIGNKITLTLYNQGVDLNNPTTKFSGTITFSNGEKYAFAINNFVKKKCFLGMLTSTDPQTPAETPLAFGLQRLGIADYRKVEQEVCCYVPGEVSHIENIMAREHKLKSVTRIRRQETTDTFSSETERENLTETTSTDRFEMNQEMSSLSSKDQSFNASAGIHWGAPGGSFGGQANASFATNTSSEDSNSQAISHAKELTERALDRVVQKVREERVTKVIEEYEENSSHGFDNRKGDKHISGVYRWVDKVYRNQVLNYGKRLMYEFMIPEPATFHDLAIQIDGNDDILVKPTDPRTASLLNMKDHKVVNSNTYKHWAAIYNAEVEPKPQSSISVTKSYSKDDMAINSGRFAHAGHEKIDLPENYYATSYNGYFTLKQGNHSGTWRRNGDVVVGGNKHSFNQIDKVPLTGNFYSRKVINSVDFSVSSWDVGAYAFNLRVDCSLTPEAEEAWQIETFNTIIAAYENQLAVYNEKYEAQKAKQEEKVNVNPGFYRQIERTVLRKNCLSYLIGQENLGKDMVQNRDSLTGMVAKYNDPGLDDYAARIKFFEQAFEWDIMSYHFYPFYWANKQKWGELYQIQNNDPLFRAFLQSGMARVIITVRPGFEEMVNWYLATGQVWNGGQVPTVDDEEFVSIVDELRNPESEVEETWETRVPTSLTVIQAGAIGLNVDGLPCDTDCDDWLQFDSDGSPALDPDGNPISDNPIVPVDDLIGGGEGVGSDSVSPIIVQ